MKFSSIFTTVSLVGGLSLSGMAGPAIAGDPVAGAALFVAEFHRICLDTRSEAKQISQYAKDQGWKKIRPKKFNDTKEFNFYATFTKERIKAWEYELSDHVFRVGVLKDEGGGTRCEFQSEGLDRDAVVAGLEASTRIDLQPEVLGNVIYEVPELSRGGSYVSATGATGRILHYTYLFSRKEKN